MNLTNPADTSAQPELKAPEVYLDPADDPALKPVGVTVESTVATPNGLEQIAHEATVYVPIEEDA